MRMLLVILIGFNMIYSQTEDKKFDVGLSYGLSHDSNIHNNPFILSASYKFKNFDKIALKGAFNVLRFGSNYDGISSEWGLNPNLIGSVRLTDNHLFFNLGIGYYFGSFNTFADVREDINSPIVIKEIQINHTGLTVAPGLRFYPNSFFFIDASFLFLKANSDYKSPFPEQQTAKRKINHNTFNLGIGFSF